MAISYVASADRAQAVVDKLKAKGVRAIAIRSDQADMAAAKPLIDQVMAHFGKLDILINNAAIAAQVSDREGHLTLCLAGSTMRPEKCPADAEIRAPAQTHCRSRLHWRPRRPVARRAVASAPA